MDREYDNNPKQEFSDEFLNAFLDNQLTLEEKDRAYLRISQDEALNRRVCELRKIQDMVRLSYQDPPASPMRPAPDDRYGRLGLSLAAGIALVIGVGIGWVLHVPGEHPAPAGPAIATPAVVVPAGRASAAPPARVVRASGISVPGMRATPTADVAPIPPDIHAPIANGDTVKVLIHVNSGNPVHHQQVLDEIDGLARYYRDHDQMARIEVVINGEGLGLVRTDATVHAERVRELQQKYDNLTFAACQNTMDRLKREQNVTARLLPGVIVIDSGVAQIMRRQQQGWAYIRV